MQTYYIVLISLVGINAAIALSLNLITGLCGQVSLGHAAFVGIGAYATALVLKAGGSLPLALGLALLLAIVAGALVALCSLRVQEDALAITTMATGVIFAGIIKANDFLGGELGVSGVPAVFSPSGVAVAALLLLAVAIAVSYGVRSSWAGRAYDAIATDERTARALGVDVKGYKISAFVIGTAIAALAGGVMTLHLRAIGVESFDFHASVAILVAVIIGGNGSIAGVLLASVLLTLMPEFSRFALDYRQILFGLVLIIFGRFLPQGISGVARTLWARGRHG